MGKKYIIEIEDGKEGIILCQKGIVTVGLHLENESELKPLGIQSAIPYTEPDLEQVRKEAYEKGWKEAEDHYDDGYSDGYDAGLIDAWKAARTIIHMPEGDLLNIFTECYSAVCTALQVLLKYDAAEAIEKLKAYEQERGIKVGDEVGYYGVADEHGNVCYSGVVLEIREDDYLVMEKTGKTYALKKNLVMSKTGRHFDEISTVLEKMREGQE